MRLHCHLNRRAHNGPENTLLLSLQRAEIWQRTCFLLRLDPLLTHTDGSSGSWALLTVLYSPRYYLLLHFCCKTALKRKVCARLWLPVSQSILLYGLLACIYGSPCYSATYSRRFGWELWSISSTLLFAWYTKFKIKIRGVYTGCD